MTRLQSARTRVAVEPDARQDRFYKVFQPTTFGNYFLTRRLAVGGMAEVFAAKLYGSDGFEKDIVIKQILPQYARDPEFVQSFVAEAKIAVTLNHANIVGIYELGRVDGTYFIAMELVDGLDVYTMNDTARRTGEALSAGVAAYIVEEAAKGLDYAHRKYGPDGKPLGLVHRDLSPRNVLVSREGEVKILDFGIAKTRSEAAAMPKTRAGVVKGTSGYMSPEQATGGEVDARTDVYQAGLLLFELLTGEALFWRPDDEETRELMRRHRIFRPSELVPAVPPELDQICLAALARDPAKRIQTAQELGAVLARFRIAHYPNVGPRGLGELVGRLSAHEAAAEEAAAAVLPSTRELKEVLTQARKPESPPRVETIATRAPMTPAATPAQTASVAAAQTDSSARIEMDGALRTGEPAVSVIAAAVVTQAPLALAMNGHGSGGAALPISVVPPVVTQFPLRQKPSSMMMLLVVAALAGTIGAIGYVSVRDEAVPAPVRPPLGVDPLRGVQANLQNGAGTTGTETETTTKSAGSTLAAVPAQQDNPPLANTTKRPAKNTAAKVSVGTIGYAAVSFGTRSCSSRVTVDGVIVARSTPSYDHKLVAGTHTITIEGTSCPPIERPGSLKSAIPSVTKEVSVDAGSTLKIIADFERETMHVR